MKTPDEIKKGLETCIGKCTGNKPHCTYHECGDGCMDMMNRDALTYINQLEARLVEANKTSDDLRAKLAEYEKPLVPLTEVQIYNDPVWLEMRAEGVALMIADIVPSFDEPGSKAEITLLGNARRAHLPYAHYGSSWRCWSRKPTDEERKAAKWDD